MLNPNIKIGDYIYEFEKYYTRITQKGMTLLPFVIAFKVLDSSWMDARDRQIMLTGVNYSQHNTLFKQTKNALRKIYGQQVTPNPSTQGPAIKLELAHGLC